MSRQNPIASFIPLFYLICFLAVATITQADSTEKRLVSVDGNATEILVDLGLGDQIVAADMTSQPLLPKAVPDLGYHRALSAEGILDTRPKLIIGSNHMGPPATLAALEKAKIPVVSLQSPETLDQLIDNISTLAKQVDRQPAGEKLADEIRTRQQTLTEKLPETAPKMVFLLDIGDRGLSQAGTSTTGNALIQLLGGENISQFSGYQSVSVEALLATNPDVILVGSRADSLDSAEKLLERQPLLKHSKAGTQNQVVSVNAATLIAGLSLGALTEAERLANKLYP